MSAQKTAGVRKINKSNISNISKAAKYKPADVKIKKGKDIEEIKKAKGSFFLKIAFFTLVIIVLLNLAANLHKINSAKAELESLKQQHNSDRINNDALQQKLDAPIDEDYIANVVKDMGYRKSDEILFYLDSDN